MHNAFMPTLLSPQQRSVLGPRRAGKPERQVCAEGERRRLGVGIWMSHRASCWERKGMRVEGDGTAGRRSAAEARFNQLYARFYSPIRAYCNRRVRADAVDDVTAETFLTMWRRIDTVRSEEHTSELQSQSNLVCRLLLEKKNKGNSGS